MIVCPACRIVNDRDAGVAAFQFASPACDPVTVHAPAATNARVFEGVIEQVAGVVVVNVTSSPEFAVALR